MANACGNSAYKGCPASFYMRCKGFTEGRNCWDLSDKPCCKNTNPAICSECKVYIKCSQMLSAGT